MVLREHLRLEEVTPTEDPGVEKGKLVQRALLCALVQLQTFFLNGVRLDHVRP